MRHGRAPRAMRTAVSRERAVARASMRLPRFTHMISSTAPIAASSKIRPRREPETICSCSAVTSARRVSASDDNSLVKASCTEFSSAYAWARVTFGRNRASTT